MGTNNKKVLITGHNGFIGKHLCSKLITDGFSVVGIGRNSNKNYEYKFLSFENDISDKILVSKIIKENNPEIIVHLAGGSSKYSSYDNFYDHIDLEQRSAFNIIDAALRLPNLEKFIFIGTCEEYGCIKAPFLESSQELPNTFYGLAKLSISRFLQSLSRLNDFPLVILRPTIVYGPGQHKKMFISDLINHLLSNQVFDMSAGMQTRDFVYIDDLIRSILCAISAKDCNGEIINISSSIPVLIKDLAREIEFQIYGNRTDLINYGAKGYRNGEALDYYADNSKAKKLLDWVPEISLAEGLSRTIEWKRQIIENS